jgi:hypothetical protein
MRKPVLGLVVGGVLGVLDGLSAWSSPAARSFMAPIVIGSTIKGLITGVIVGYVARRTNSMTTGVVTGLVAGLVLSFLAATSSDIPGGPHYFEIMLPGALVGVIVGVVTQRYGSPKIPKPSRSP